MNLWHVLGTAVGILIIGCLIVEVCWWLIKRWWKKV